MRIQIIEDEPLAQRRLERMIKDVMGQEATAVSVSHDLAQGQKHLLEIKPDLVFLDLDLNGEDGFAILREFSAEPSHTVIVSAHTDRAIEAYELGALDFIPKPVSRDRLDHALRRFHRRTDDAHCAKLVSTKSGTGTVTTPISRIARLEAEGNYVRLVLMDGNSLLHSKSLDRLLTLLPSSFVRIHRSHAVNISQMDQISAIEGSQYRCLLKNGTTLPVGRTRVSNVRHALQQHSDGLQNEY